MDAHLIDAIREADRDIAEWLQLARRQREEMDRPDYNPICPTDRAITASERVRRNIHAAIQAADARMQEIRAKLESIVCTEGEDAGVVLLSQDGPTHTEIVNGQPVQVYDHEYFSPLGDALMELYGLLKPHV